MGSVEEGDELIAMEERKQRKGWVFLKPFERDERKIHQRLGTTEHQTPRLGRSQIFAEVRESREVRLMGHVGELGQEANGVPTDHSANYVGIN